MINKNSPIPLYEQLDTIIRSKINNQEWKSNSIIPSENYLSELYKISRTTVRKVITNLVNEDILFRVQGKGTFVSEQKITAKTLAYMGIREQLEQMGYKTSTRLLEFDQVKANNKLIRVMDINSDDVLYYIERLRYIQETPISIHRSWIPKKFAPTLKSSRLESEQLCVILLQEFDLKPVFMIETLESTLSDEKEAELLNVEEKFPLLLLEDVYKDKYSHPYEYTQVIFRGDKIKLHFEYQGDSYYKWIRDG